MKSTATKVLLAALAMVLTVAVAQAQHPGMSHGGNNSAMPKEDKGPKADEKAYKEALKTVPTPDKKPADPWKGAR